MVVISLSGLEHSVTLEGNLQVQYIAAIGRFLVPSINAQTSSWTRCAENEKSEDFHVKCDRHNKTLLLAKADSGYIYGGFSDVTWKSGGKWHTKSNA